jgi:hypothetical protein
VQERTLSRAGSCGDNLKSLFREKEFLPGLLAENRDGNGSLPRSRNLISEKVFTRPSTLYGRGRADIHHGPESMTPLKAEYIGADQLPCFVFRLQLYGGPYIPITPFHRTWPRYLGGVDTFAGYTRMDDVMFRLSGIAGAKRVRCVGKNRNSSHCTCKCRIGAPRRILHSGRAVRTFHS